MYRCLFIVLSFLAGSWQILAKELEAVAKKPQQQALQKPVVTKLGFCQGYQITNLQDAAYIEYELWVNGQLHYKLPKNVSNNWYGGTTTTQSSTFNECVQSNFVLSGTAFIRMKHLGSNTHVDSDTFTITPEKPEAPQLELVQHSDCGKWRVYDFRKYATYNFYRKFHMYENNVKVYTYETQYNSYTHEQSQTSYQYQGGTITFTLEAINGQESDHSTYPLIDTDFKPIIEKKEAGNNCGPYLIRNFQTCADYTYTLLKGTQSIPFNKKEVDLGNNSKEHTFLDCTDPNFEPNTQYTLRVTKNGVTHETTFTTQPFKLEVTTTPNGCNVPPSYKISNVAPEYFSNLTFDLYKDGNLVQANMKVDNVGRITLNYPHSFAGNYILRYKGVDSEPFEIRNNYVIAKPILAPMREYKNLPCCASYERFKIVNYDPNLEYKVEFCVDYVIAVDEFYIGEQSHNTTPKYTILSTGEVVVNKCDECFKPTHYGSTLPVAIDVEVTASIPGTTSCAVKSEIQSIGVQHHEIKDHNIEHIPLANCEKQSRVRLDKYDPSQYTYSILLNGQPVTGATINLTTYEIEGVSIGNYAVKIVRNSNTSCVKELSFYIQDQPFGFEIQKTQERTCTQYERYDVVEHAYNQDYRVLRGTEVIKDWNKSYYGGLYIWNLGEEHGAGVYTIEAKNNQGCFETKTFEIKPLHQPSVPQIEVHQQATCNTLPQYRIANYDPTNYVYLSNDPDIVIDNQGVITSNKLGNYKITTNRIEQNDDYCIAESSEMEFFYYPTPGKPLVVTIAATCTQPSSHSVTLGSEINASPMRNIVPTYKVYNAQGTEVLSQASPNIVGLTEGTYRVKVVSQHGCTSEMSEPFEVKGIHPKPQKPVLEAHAQATCSSVSLFKIRDYNAADTYKVYDDAYATNTQLNGITFTAEGVVQGIARDGRYRVERVNAYGCGTVSDPIEVLPKVPYPNKAGVDIFTPATCTSPNKYRISDYNDKLKYKVYTEAGVLVTNVTIKDLGHIEIASGRYKIKVEGDSCESEFSEIFEIIDRLPQPPVPVVTTTQASCTQKSKHVVTLDAQYRYAVYSGDNPVSATVLADGTIFLPDGLPAGVYNVKAQDKTTGCYSQGADFTTEPVRTKEVTPQVVLSQGETCQAPSLYKIQNWVAGVTYKVYHNSQVVASASVDNQGNISGLQANKVYTIVAEKAGSCPSDHSNAFTLTPQKPAPAIPTLQEIGYVVDAASCKEVAQYRITNYNNAYQYKICEGTNTGTCSEVQNIVIGSAGVINGVLPTDFTIQVTDPVGTCTSVATFQRQERAYTYPKPNVGAAANANCNSVSTFQITNYDAQATYTILDNQNSAVAGANVDNQGAITGINTHGNYKVKAVRGACESISDTFAVGAQLPTPQKPVVVQASAASCTSATMFRVEPVANGVVYKVYNNGVEVTTASVDTNTGNIQNLVAGTYTIKAFQGTCQSEASESFVVEAVKPTPQKPVIESKPATCSAASSHQIQNVETGATYEVYQSGQKVPSAVVTSGGQIQSLTAGSYTLKVLKDGCESESDSFEVQDQKPSPVKPVVTKVTEATCEHTTIYQVQGYNPAYTYKVEYYNGNPVVGHVIEVVYNPVTWAKVNPSTGNVEIDKAVYKAILPAQHTTDTPALRVVATLGDCTQYSTNFLPEVALDKPATPRVSTTAATCTSASVNTIQGYDPQNTYRVYNQASNTLVGATIDPITGVITGLTQGETYVLKVFKGCESDASNTFTFEQQHVAPAQPNVVLQSAATCTSSAVYKIENYDATNLDYGYYTNQNAFGTYFSLTQVNNNGVLSLPVGTYKIEVNKKGQSCKIASQEFTIEDIKQKPQTPSLQITPATCQEPTRIKIDNYNNLNTYKVYDQAGAVVNTVVINAGAITGLATGQNYTLKVTTPNGCESDPSQVFTYELQHSLPPVPVVVRHAKEDCTSATLYKIQNYDANLKYVVYNLQFVNAPVRVTIDSQGIIRGLRAGEYNVEALTPHGCSEVSDDFEVQAKLRTPDSPNVILYEAESCNSTTQYHIDSYSRVAKYKIYDDANQEVTATISSLGVVSGLPVGTYRMSVAIAGCESDLSDSFQVKDKLSKPTKLASVVERLCPTAQTELFDMGTLIQPQAGHILRWYNDPTTNAYTEIAPTQDRKVTTRTTITKFVTQIGASNCESERTEVTLVLDDTQAPEFTQFPDNLVINCQDVDFEQKVMDWLAQAQATDNCIGAVQVQNNYTKPADLCNKPRIEVTFTIVDSFGNQKQQKSSIVFISAKDDDFTTHVVPSTGGIVNNAGVPVNVLTNDKLRGRTPDVSQVTIVVEGSSDPNVTIDVNTGEVTVANGTPNGVHTITYRICDKANNTACSQIATVSVKVANTPIVAVQERYEVNKTQGGTTPSVLENDTLDGNKVNPREITLTKPNGLPHGMTMDDQGRVVVLPNTPVGVYEVEYKICENANLHNCSTIISFVSVTDKNVIQAVTEDFGPISSVSGGTTPSVLENDTLNGNTFAADAVVLTKPTNLPIGITMNDDGTLLVTPGTVAGVYSFDYTICDASDTNICSSVTSKVRVSDISNGGLDLVKITDKVEVRVGGKIMYRFKITNNGTDVLTQVKLTDRRLGIVDRDVPDLNPGQGIELTFDYTITQEDIDAGKVVNTAFVMAKNPARETIGDTSDNNTPSVDENKDGDLGNDPTITILRTIEANSDKGSFVGKSGGRVSGLNILNNDKLGSFPEVNPSNVVITAQPSNELVVNPDGTIDVKPGVPTGTYQVDYTICDVTISDLCATTKVTIDVVNDECVLEIFNAISANNDGQNDVLYIKNIECYPDNVLRIFNRWGIEVFNTERYNNTDNVFRGFSNARATIGDKKLPQGTYYLVIEYKTDDNQVKQKGTWIYLSNNN